MWNPTQADAFLSGLRSERMRSTDWFNDSNSERSPVITLSLIPSLIKETILVRKLMSGF